MKEKQIKPKKEVVGRTWEYDPNPRLEGLLQASKYLKWKNVESFKASNKKEKNK